MKNSNRNKKKKSVSIYAELHKDIGQFCLDNDLKFYEVIAESFYFMRDKKKKKLSPVVKINPNSEL